LLTIFGGAKVRRAFFARIIDDPRINERLPFGAEIDSRTACFGSDSGLSLELVNAPHPHSVDHFVHHALRPPLPWPYRTLLH
jgi:hypothetical protein